MKSSRELDDTLVELAKAGDMHAFNQIFQRYKIRLTRYLLPIIRDAGETDDVVQETFIRAYRALEQFQGHSMFSTWLFTIATNTARQRLSRRSRQIPLANELDDDAMSADGADLATPEAQMESKEMMGFLEHALAALPPEQRISFELRELEGLSYEEIASKMDCPVGTVRSRIHRARENLAEALRHF